MWSFQWFASFNKQITLTLVYHPIVKWPNTGCKQQWSRSVVGLMGEVEWTHQQLCVIAQLTLYIPLHVCQNTTNHNRLILYLLYFWTYTIAYWAHSRIDINMFALRFLEPGWKCLNWSKIMTNSMKTKWKLYFDTYNLIAF